MADLKNKYIGFEPILYHTDGTSFWANSFVLLNLSVTILIAIMLNSSNEGSFK